MGIAEDERAPLANEEKREREREKKKKKREAMSMMMTKRTPTSMRLGGKAKKTSKTTKSTKGWGGGEGGSGDLSKWYGAGRKLYLPGGLLTLDDVPSYLNGTLAGDYGYDPLGLGTDVEQVNKYREYELIHARWAMLGAAGAIIPEGLAANGADIKGATWFETGKVLLEGNDLNYFAVPWGVVNNPLPLIVVLGAQVASWAQLRSLGSTRLDHQGMLQVESSIATSSTDWTPTTQVAHSTHLASPTTLTWRRSSRSRRSRTEDLLWSPCWALQFRLWPLGRDHMPTGAST